MWRTSELLIVYRIWTVERPDARTVGLRMLEVPVYNEIPCVLTDWCIGTFLQPNDDFRLAIDQETRWIVSGGTTRQKADEHERQPF